MPSADSDDRGERGESEVEDGAYAEVATSVARGGLWSAGGQALGLIVGLIATPFTIRLLGPAGYGVWSLLLTVMGWFALADFGMSTTSTKFAGDALAEGDSDGEVQSIWVAAAITLTITGIVAVLAAVFAPKIVTDGLQIHGSLRKPAILGLRLLCVSLLATAANSSFTTSQQIRLKWRSFTIITVGTSVLQVALIPIVLKAFAGGVAMACAVAVAMAVVNVIGTLAVARRLTPTLFRVSFSTERARRMLRFGAALTVSGLATIPLTSAERLFLAHYSTPVQVSYYVVAGRLAMLLAAIPQAVIAPLFPALVALESSASRAAAQRLYRSGLVVTFALLTPAAILLAFIARPFLGAWAGEVYAQHSTELFAVILVGVWFNVLSYMPDTYISATGHAATLARVRLAELVPYLIAAAVLTAQFGAIGAAAVWSGRAVIDGLIFFVVSKRALGASISPLSARWPRALMVLSLLAVAALLAAQVTPGLALRAAVALVLAVFYALLVWRAVFTVDEREAVAALWSRLTGPFARRRG